MIDKAFLEAILKDPTDTVCSWFTQIGWKSEEILTAISPLVGSASVTHHRYFWWSRIARILQRG